MLSESTAMRRGRLAAIAVAACMAVGAAGAAPASASTTIESFSVSPSSTQAGGHPDLAISFSLDASEGAETAKSATVNAPTGIVFAPLATVTCASSEFALDECPSTSQVGVVTIRGGYEEEREYHLGTAPVYALERTESDFGGLGFTVPTVNEPVVAGLSLREGTDYGLRLKFGELPESAPVADVSLSIWGIPAAPGHDAERFPKGAPGEPPGCPGLEDASCNSPHSSTLPQSPFVVYPTVCTTQLDATLEVRTYEDAQTATMDQASVPSATGCDQLKFEPSLAVTPTTTSALTPSGLDVDLSDPQPLSPTVPSPSQLRSYELILPEGMTINSELPEGLVVCTEAEAHLGTEEPSACPEEALLGTATLELATISAPLVGEIFLGTVGQEEPRLFLVAAGGGIELKLVGVIEEEEEETGQLSIAFWDQPQLPIVHFKLHFFGGRQALFRTPVHCGAYPVEGGFDPWGGPELANQFAELSFTIISGPSGGPCIGDAKAVTLHVTPPTVPADGRSRAEVTIKVTDENGAGIPEEDVELSSSDPGEKIGEITDNEDGTYSATITASTTPGADTITATDLSVEPRVRGSATLTQTALGQAALTEPVSPPAPAPVVSFLRKPPRKSTNRRPRFSFRAEPAGVTFFCKLDHGRFRRCTSPVNLPKLAFGPHTFSVYARAGTVNGRPAAWRFTVLRHHHKRSP